MNRCPICRGRINAASACTRCGTDLTTLITIQRDSRVHCQLAINALQTNDYSKAKRHAQKARAFHHTPFTHQLALFIGQVKTET